MQVSLVDFDMEQWIDSILGRSPPRRRCDLHQTRLLFFVSFTAFIIVFL